MAITSLPPNITDTNTLACVLCSVKLTLDKATAGFWDGDGRQTFACVSHFSELEKLINGWADFMARERTAHLHSQQQPESWLQ